MIASTLGPFMVEWAGIPRRSPPNRLHFFDHGALVSVAGLEATSQDTACWCRTVVESWLPRV